MYIDIKDKMILYQMTTRAPTTNTTTIQTPSSTEIAPKTTTTTIQTPSSTEPTTATTIIQAPATTAQAPNTTTTTIQTPSSTELASSTTTTTIQTPASTEPTTTTTIIQAPANKALASSATTPTIQTPASTAQATLTTSTDQAPRKTQAPTALTNKNWAPRTPQSLFTTASTTQLLTTEAPSIYSCNSLVLITPSCGYFIFFCLLFIICFLVLCNIATFLFLCIFGRKIKPADSDRGSALVPAANYAEAYTETDNVSGFLYFGHHSVIDVIIFL